MRRGVYCLVNGRISLVRGESRGISMVLIDDYGIVGFPCGLHEFHEWVDVKDIRVVSWIVGVVGKVVVVVRLKL